MITYMFKKSFQWSLNFSLTNNFIHNFFLTLTCGFVSFSLQVCVSHLCLRCGLEHQESHLSLAQYSNSRLVLAVSVSLVFSLSVLAELDSHFYHLEKCLIGNNFPRVLQIYQNKNLNFTPYCNDISDWPWPVLSRIISERRSSNLSLTLLFSLVGLMGL